MLIKRHKPLFNVRFRDDKRYPILRLDVTHPFPTLTVVRRFEKDGALYYGPYTSSRTMRTILRVIERYFPLRRCNGEPGSQDRECLNYQIKKCPGVCRGHVSAADYADTVKQVQLLLAGRNDELIYRLESEMREFSEALNFEAAALKRDQLKAVKNISGGRRLLLPRPVDMDVFAFESRQSSAYAEIMLIRAGMVSGNVHLHLDLDNPIPLNRIADHFMTHYYREGAPLPRLVLCNTEPASRDILERFLTEMAGRKTTIRVPRKGIHASLLRLATSNLKLHRQADERTRSTDAGLLALKKRLNLPRAPLRIEAVDISESQGKHAVGSVVSFENGKPQRDRYRRYRIQSETATSDVDRIREVMTRRLKRKRLPEWSLPDLFLIDGGKPQLNAACAVARELGLDDLRIIGLAKARNNRKKEGIFLSDGTEINPPPDDPALLYLDAIRDEAHRFAITYHRTLRARAQLRSQLSGIPGIGPHRRKLLLEAFGSVDRLKKAAVEDIAAVPGFGRKTAAAIKNALDSKLSRSVRKNPGPAEPPEPG